MQPFLRPTILLVVFITLKYFIVHVFVFVGTQRPDFIPEVGEDAVDAVPCSPCMALTEKEQAELCSELAKVSILQSSYISTCLYNISAAIQWLRFSQDQVWLILKAKLILQYLLSSLF